MKNNKNKSAGITLIALVVTIIVLLILAGISISMLSGDNSILQRATDAKETTERADAKEQAQLDILAWQSDKISKGENSDLDDTIIQGILAEKNYVKSADATSFTTLRGEYVILYSELYQTSQNNSTPITEIDESEKLKNYYISNNFSSDEVIETSTIDGNFVRYGFYNNEDEKDYVTYNGNLYKVEYESSEYKVINVEFVMSLNSFGEQQISGVDVLIIPNSLERQIYDEYGVFSYITVNDMENTKTGYIVDNDGNDCYYDESGNLLKDTKGTGDKTPLLVTPDSFIHNDYEVGDVIVCEDINEERKTCQRTYDLSGTLISVSEIIDK